ncbi:MAG TPA: DEAD/DEAH box helicase family protein [Roseiarcus sp.]|nr:DEAD/DEAH box helicase family protein [Roseiarcus sp.]
MRLKDYQTGALDTLSTYLKILRAEDDKRAQELFDIDKLPAATREKIIAMLGDPVDTAWAAAQAHRVAASPDPWRSLKDGVGRSIPYVCLKLPTGGGKTLLAAHAVDRILVSHFRQTSGFVLWIVPSEAIYAQTKAQLTDRGNPIRQALDRASGGRVKVLEKLDGFAKADVEQRLCVLLLMLQSTGRKDKETLKVFRDSGQYTSFFPQDDPIARAALLKRVSNLEQADLAEAALGGESVGWIKQSLGNTLRLIRPIIVLDEGHRAYSEMARGTLASLNPRFLLELSATPDRSLSNILVNVSGRALKDEEMIKLPIRLEVGRKLRWQTTLQNALDRLGELERSARKYQDTAGRYIRPIMVIRVDRTGKDQRDRAGELVHSEDAFEFLTQKAGVPAEAIRRQTAEVKELKGDDLLSPYCPVRVIITKDALREGWDCPFAYVLAILSKGTAKTALTQMIGRVLRQPQAARTGIEMLDEAHVFCADVEVGEAVERIKGGLEAEGMGDLAGEIRTGKGSAGNPEIEMRFRREFRGSRIMVPRVLHRDGKKKYRDLDYEADVLACVDFEKLKWREADTFSLAAYDISKREAFAVDLAAGAGFDLTSSAADAVIVDSPLDRPGLVRRMLDIVPNPWQGARILDEAIAALRKRAKDEEINVARLMLVENIKRDIQKQVEAAAEQAFRKKVLSGDIVFKLLAAPLDDLNFEFVERYTTHIASGDAQLPLLHSGGKPLDRALYERVYRKDFNNFEADVALYVDAKDAVTWWWRIAARREWGLQGWMRSKVYPDFLIRLDETKDIARLLVLETKGKHLEGSEDTEFKAKFFKLLEDAYTLGKEAGEVELFGDSPESMRFRILLQDLAWQSDLEAALP